MPIKGLTDRGQAFPQIGTIRKGDKKTENKPGKDLTYFRVEIDEREKEAIASFDKAYGPKPTDLNVLLPFNEIEKFWDAWRELYNTGALVHRCDGEFVNYEIDPVSGQVLVRDWLNDQGERVACKLQKHPDKRKRCRPVGRLKVVIPELGRLGYFTLNTTSLFDVIHISEQLGALAQINNGQMAGVPMILKRRPAMVSTPITDKETGQTKRARVEKWLISIEANPKWVAAKIKSMHLAALPEFARPLIDGPKAETPIDEEDEIEDENIIDNGTLPGEADHAEAEAPAEINLPTTGEAFVEWRKKMIEAKRFTMKESFDALGEDAHAFAKKHGPDGYRLAAQTILAVMAGPQE